MSERYYAGHPDFAGEVDHAQLVAQLVTTFPDGWALSTSSKTLAQVLALCPDDVRIGAWTKPAPPGYTARARCSWEPVIFAGGRPRPVGSPTLLDWVHAAPMRSYPGAVTGTKPPGFCRWVFDCLGAQPGDELVDLFPGSGAVGRAWDRYVSPVDGRPVVEDLGDAGGAGPITPARPGSGLSVDPGPSDSRESVHLVPATGHPGPGDASAGDRHESRRPRARRDGSGSLEVLGDALLRSFADPRDASTPLEVRRDASSLQEADGSRSAAAGG